MSQTTNYPENPYFARLFEHRFDQNFAFDFLFPGFFSIDGDGLPKDFRGPDSRCNSLCCVAAGRRRGNIRASKSSLLNHSSLSWPRVADRDTIAQSGAGYNPTSSIGGSRAVA